jgi:hypothetical protein
MFNNFLLIRASHGENHVRRFSFPGQSGCFLYPRLRTAAGVNESIRGRRSDGAHKKSRDQRSRLEEREYVPAFTG